MAQDNPDTIAGDPPQEILDQLIALHGQGHSVGVAEQAASLLRIFTESYWLWHIYGGVLLDLQLFEAAELALGRAASLVPEMTEAALHHSVSLRALGQPARAEAVARRAVALAPTSAEALTELAAVMSALGRHDEALKLSRRILRRDPASLTARYNQAIALQALGRKAGARKAFEEVLKRDPTHVEALRNLARLRDWTPGDPLLAHMRALLQEAGLPNRARSQLLFALFTAHDRLDQPARAYPYLAEANALRRRDTHHDLQADRDHFDAIRAQFGALAPLKVASDTPVPIFILGMPRSGTTLCEQILSAHGDVAAGDELELVAPAAQALLAQGMPPDPAALQDFREGYLEAVRPMAGSCGHITDKMPHNFRYIGLIAAALPEARILHVHRAPEAVCWSNLRQSFASTALGYADDLRDVVAYHGLYRRLMEFWQTRWPGRIQTLDYDALTEAPDLHIPELLHALGLPPDPACLAPERNGRAVRTASVVQVRRRIYRGSSQDWRRYAPWLEEAFADLRRV